MSIKNQLFSTHDWSSFAAYQRSRLEDEISTLEGDRMLNTSILDLSNYFAEKYKITVPTLHKDRIVVDQREAQVEISGDRTRYLNDRGRAFLVTGTVVEVSVPFEGEAECFYTQPSTFTFSPPYGEVEENEAEGSTLLFHIEGVDLTIDQVRAQIQQTLNDITQNLKFLRVDADRFNSNLYSYAHGLIARRRKKLFTDRNLVSGLGFRIKERDEQSALALTPASQRPLVPTLPPASTLPYAPEPVLTAKDFARILEVIQKSARLLHYSPSLLPTLDLASLRAHFLLHLNATFESKHQDETFIAEGKSDIVIRTDGKCIFIASCAAWVGQDELEATVNRILSYSSWRDTKAALLLFYRNDQSRNDQPRNDQPHNAQEDSVTAMVESMRATLYHHVNFKHELPQLAEEVFPYVFAHHSDRNREMLLTALTFDLSPQE